MEKNKIIVLIGVILVVILSGFFALPEKKPVETKILSPQTIQIGELTIQASPKVLAVGEKPQFNLQFDTHSIELVFDIAGSSYLLNNFGKKLVDPIWQGTPPGGHHRSGQLIFSSILSETEYVDLVIKQVLDNKEARFRWQLKGGD